MNTSGVDALKLYIASTSLWPQRRNAIAIHMLDFLLSNAEENFFSFLEYRYSEEDYERVGKAMGKMHDPCDIDRVFSNADLIRDWDNTKGAVVKCLLIYLDETPPCTSDGYSSCLTEGNIDLVYTFSRSPRLVESARYEVDLARTCLRRNLKLSALYRFTFRSKATPIHAEEKLKYLEILNRYFKSKDLEKLESFQVWGALGGLVKEHLVAHGIIHHEWLTWGFD